MDTIKRRVLPIYSNGILKSSSWTVTDLNCKNSHAMKSTLNALNSNKKLSKNYHETVSSLTSLENEIRKFCGHDTEIKCNQTKVISPTETKLTQPGRPTSNLRQINENKMQIFKGNPLSNASTKKSKAFGSCCGIESLGRLTIAKF